ALAHHPIRSSRFAFSSNATPPTVIYTLSLHDALPIWAGRLQLPHGRGADDADAAAARGVTGDPAEALHLGPRRVRVHRDGRRLRSEEHTSELQSRENLVCRLLLEKKKMNNKHQSCTPV